MGEVPLLGTPGPAKSQLSQKQFQPLWDAAVTALHEADVIVFAGYRFPPSDSHSRTTLLRAIKHNSAKRLRVHTVLGPRTHDEDTVRLVKLLEHTLRSAGRIAEGEGYATPDPRFSRSSTNRYS